MKNKNKSDKLQNLVMLNSSIIISESLNNKLSETEYENRMHLLRSNKITRDIRIKLIRLKLPLPASPVQGPSAKSKPDNRKNQRRTHAMHYCPYSNCNFKHHFGIKNHLLKVHKEPLKPYECRICKKSFKTQSKAYLKSHMRTYHGTKKRTINFKCTICAYTAYTAQALSHHIRTHTQTKTVCCFVCGWVTNYRRALKCHMEVHHLNQEDRPRPFKCPHPQCNHAANTSSKLKLHIRTHTGDKPFKCTFCPYASTHRYNLHEHLRRHTKEKPYACSFCPHKCTAKCDLDSHMRSHTKERPFACELCEYRTTQRGHLNFHFKRFHTAEGQTKNIKCTLCPAAFRTLQALEYHTARHTGERPFKCQFCDKCFTQAGAKNNHERACPKRTDGLIIKPYFCKFPNCNYSASSSSSLTVHQKSKQLHTQ